jgi:hypothetical protein
VNQCFYHAGIEDVTVTKAGRDRSHNHTRMSKRNTLIFLLAEPMFVLVCLASMPGIPAPRILDSFVNIVNQFNSDRHNSIEQCR